MNWHVVHKEKTHNMKRLISFVKKEFHHVLRDPKTLMILFGLPIVQIMIFGFALTNEVKNSKIVVLDQSKDASALQLLNKIEASRYFEIEKSVTSRDQMEEAFKEGKIKMAIVIPDHFQHDLLHDNKASIQIISDATDPNTANMLNTYVNAIINDFQSSLMQGTNIPYRIIPEVKMLYNPQLKGVHNFVPGVMALVLMLVCVMMTAIAIVREKETGTMEILLVSPFQPLMVIVAKTIPYLILSLVNVTMILALSVLVLDLPINGSLVLLFAVSTLFILTCLSLGMFISVKTQTQQAAMLISLVGMLLPTLLFSGFMFPIENMPLPLQIVSNIVPAKWYYIMIKSIMIKGLGFMYIWKPILILSGITLFFIVISIKNFKIRLA